MIGFGKLKLIDDVSLYFRMTYSSIRLLNHPDLFSSCKKGFDPNVNLDFFELANIRGNKDIVVMLLGIDYHRRLKEWLCYVEHGE